MISPDLTELKSSVAMLVAFKSKIDSELKSMPRVETELKETKSLLVSIEKSIKKEMQDIKTQLLDSEKQPIQTGEGSSRELNNI